MSPEATISRWQAQSRDQFNSGQINQHPVQILAYLLFLIYSMYMIRCGLALISEREWRERVLLKRMSHTDAPLSFTDTSVALRDSRRPRSVLVMPGLIDEHRRVWWWRPWNVRRHVVYSCWRVCCCSSQGLFLSGIKASSRNVWDGFVMNALILSWFIHLYVVPNPCDFLSLSQNTKGETLQCTCCSFPR